MIAALLMLWLFAVAGIVVFRLLNGTITTCGLLSASGNDSVSPERAQLLVAAVFSAGAYAARAIEEWPRFVSERSLPEIPPELISIFAGSHIIYLMGKVVRRN